MASQNSHDGDSVEEVPLTTAAFRPPAFNLHRLLSSGPSNASPTPRTTPQPPLSSQSIAPGTAGGGAAHVLPGPVNSDDSSGDKEAGPDPKAKAKSRQKKRKVEEQPEPILENQKDDDDDDQEPGAAGVDDAAKKKGSSKDKDSTKKRPAARVTQKKPAAKSRKDDDEDDEMAIVPFAYAIEKKHDFQQTPESADACLTQHPEDAVEPPPFFEYFPDNQLGLYDEFATPPKSDNGSHSDGFGSGCDGKNGNLGEEASEHSHVPEQDDASASHEWPYANEDFSAVEECKPLFEAMDRSLENLDRLEVQTGGCLVPRGLCIATIKAIDGALRQLGPLCDPKHPVQEDFDGAANSGSKSPVGGSEAELDTPNRSKSPLRNAALTYDEYMKALVDDVQAEKDRVMFEEAVTVENVGQQIDNTRRVLDRSQLGLKPVPKRKPNGKNVKDGAEKPPLPRRKYVARRGGAASSAGGSKAKKGTKKVKKHDILDEVTKKQMHSEYSKG